MAGYNPFVAPTAGRGLQYQPLSPGRRALAGGLQGLGPMLMALAVGQPQQAGQAFQAGLQGFDEAQWRRAQQAREDELFRLRQSELSDRQTEREEAKVRRLSEEARWGELTGRLSDANPSNDPTGLRDILPFLPIETQMQMAGDLFPEAPKPTDDMREYEKAVEQGFTGTLLDYQTALRKSGASNNATTIYNKDYGTIPPGFRLVETPQGVMMEAIPGSPAAGEAADKTTKEQETTAQKERVGDIVLDDISRALDMSRSAKGLPSTGFVGGVLENTPGTNAHNLQQILLSVKSNISFDRLQAMRQASPTGGALGSVTEGEGKKLESVYGALAQSQTQDQFEYNLKRLANVYNDIIHGVGKGPERYDLSKKGGIGEGGKADGEVVDELTGPGWN